MPIISLKLWLIILVLLFLDLRHQYLFVLQTCMRYNNLSYVLQLSLNCVITILLNTFELLELPQPCLNHSYYHLNLHHNVTYCIHCSLVFNKVCTYIIIIITLKLAPQSRLWLQSLHHCQHCNVTSVASISDKTYVAIKIVYQSYQIRLISQPCSNHHYYLNLCHNINYHNCCYCKCLFILIVLCYNF